MGRDEVETNTGLCQRAQPSGFRQNIMETPRRHLCGSLLGLFLEGTGVAIHHGLTVAPAPALGVYAGPHYHLLVLRLFLIKKGSHQQQQKILTTSFIISAFLPLNYY